MPIQLKLLRRRDITVQERSDIAEELLQTYRDSGNALALASGYSAKGSVQAQQGDLEGAVKTLEEAEIWAKQCESEAPHLFFNTRCNRALYMVTLGKRDETVRLLQEAIEYSKPYEKSLETAHPYITLAHLAENAGARAQALQYLQSAFEIANRNDRFDTASAAVETIITILFNDKQYDLANEWMNKIQPVLAKASDPTIKQAFAIRAAELKRVGGDPAGAAEDLKQLLDTLPAGTQKQVKGQIALSLAAALLECEKYNESLAATEMARENLQGFKRSLELLEHGRLACLLAVGQVEETIAEAQKFLANESLARESKIRMLDLLAQAFFKAGSNVAAYETLQKCREEEAQTLAERAREQANFMTAAYNSEHREHELALAKEQQAAAETRAQLLSEQARRATEQVDHVKAIRNMVIAFSAITLVLGLFVMQILWYRSSTLAIAKREREFNQQMQERLARQAADLQEQLMTRRQLEMAIERKFRDEALGKLTGGVAHDFNNLLMVILHSIELIKLKEPKLASDSAELLQAITQAADSGSSIVSQLMAYTRQQPLLPRAVQATEWLQSSRTMLRQMVGNKIQYNELDQSAGATICIDVAQLTTAVINLLDNARDAVRENGRIELLIAKTHIDDVSASQWHEVTPGEYCLFEVRDNGKGMTSDELAHACEPFYTTKRSGAGTGLGLSSVLGFVKQSGGDFRLKSEPGKGTIASILIPTCQPQSKSADDHPEEVEVKRHRILLVEDQEPVRAVLAAGLKSIGYSIRQAASADEAIDIINKSGLPDIVLSDVRMPGSMNGVQLRRWILERFPSARIVLMSGYNDLDINACDAVHFVQKPVKLQELHQFLATIG